jgi:hypothetical protein
MEKFIGCSWRLCVLLILLIIVELAFGPPFVFDISQHNWLGWAVQVMLVWLCFCGAYLWYQDDNKN